MRPCLTLATGLLAFGILSATAAQAQQAGNWSGPYAVGFGEYSSGTSTQNDNGFVYRPPRPAKTATTTTTPPGNGCPAGEMPVDLGGGLIICVLNGEGGDGGNNVQNLVNADGRYGVKGAFGGGAIGYNYQLARIVAGVEGSIAGGDASGASDSCGTPAHRCGTSVDAISDVRGRLGYSFGRLLPYIAGGLAIDHVLAYDTLFNAQGKSWMAGWTAGAGLEYKVTPHLSVRAEYLHTRLDSKVLFDIVPGVPERIGYRSDAVRVGLSYSLNAFAFAEPVVAKY